MKRNYLTIVLASTLLGLLFDVLFYAKIPGVSVVLFVATILALTVALATVYKTRIRRSTLVLMPFALFFAGMVAVRASGFLSFLNVVMSLYLLMLIAELSIWRHEKFLQYTPYNYLVRLARLPFMCLEKFFGLSARAFAYKGELSAKKHHVQPIVRGVLISLPLLAVFLALFSSADPVFRKYVGSLFDFHVSGDVVAQLLLAGFVAAIFTGVYALIFMRSDNDSLADPTPKIGFKLGSTEAAIMLGSLSVLFLIFVLVQVKYFFGGSTNITVAGFTYAEYARKGFFELVVVAVLSLGLIVALARHVVRHTDTQKLVFKILSSVLIVQVMVIMLSAHKRLALYEEAYGFTELRLYSHLFIGWLAVMFVLLTVHVVREERQNQLALRVFVSAVGMLLFVNILNPDALIAQNNIQRFNIEHKVDTYYLAGLSEDAMPQVVKLLDNKDEKLRNSIARDLYWRKAQVLHDGNSWQSFNVARHNSREQITKHLQSLQDQKDFKGYYE